MKNIDSASLGASTGGVDTPQLEIPKAARKRCKAITKDGVACTAWAMPGGLCYFHGNDQGLGVYISIQHYTVLEVKGAAADIGRCQDSLM